MTIYVDKFEIISIERGIKASKRGKKQKEEKLQLLKSIADEVEDLGVDYMILGDAHGYVIERKTVSDLLSSVFHSKSKSSGRLYDQVARVRDMAISTSEKEEVPVTPILVVEGSIFAYNKIAQKTGRRPVSLKVYRGILLGVMDMGVHVVETSGFGDTIDLLLHLDERAGKSRKISQLNVKKSLRSIREEAFHMIFAVSGIGEKKASELLEKYGSVKEIVNLPKEVLVKELGPSRGAHFYEVVNAAVSKQKKLSQ